jgi:hypothetical protein
MHQVGASGAGRLNLGGAGGWPVQRPNRPDACSTFTPYQHRASAFLSASMGNTLLQMETDAVYIYEL